MKIVILAVYIALFMGSSLVQAAQNNDELLTRIQNAYAKINTFEATFNQTLTHKESGSTEKRKGTIQFQKPLQVRWQTQKPHEETLIINSREIWDYLPDEQVAYRYSPSVAQDSRSVIQVVTGQAKINKDFDVKRAANDNGLVKLALYPKDPTPDMVEAAIWVDPANGIIQRTQVIDFYGNRNDIAFQAFKPGAKIPEKQFSFTPPKGVDVEDRVESGIREKALLR